MNKTQRVRVAKVTKADKAGANTLPTMRPSHSDEAATGGHAQIKLTNQAAEGGITVDSHGGAHRGAHGGVHGGVHGESHGAAQGDHTAGDRKATHVDADARTRNLKRLRR